MKPWYKKKKVWAAILGALGPVLTIFLAPDNVETVKVIAAAIMQAGVAAGFIFAESSVDKAAAKANSKEVVEGVQTGLKKYIIDMIEAGLLPNPGAPGLEMQPLYGACGFQDVLKGRRKCRYYDRSGYCKRQEEARGDCPYPYPTNT